jgi:hypothetical protein
MFSVILLTIALTPVADARQASPLDLAEDIEQAFRKGKNLASVLLWTDAVAQSQHQEAKRRVRQAWTAATLPQKTGSVLMMISSPLVLDIEPHTLDELAKAARQNPDGGYSDWFCNIDARSPEEQELRDQFCNLPTEDTTNAILRLNSAIDLCIDPMPSQPNRTEQLEQAAAACADSSGIALEEGTRDYASEIAIGPVGAALVGTFVTVGGGIIIAVINQIWQDRRQEDQQAHEESMQARELAAKEAEKKAECGECTCENMCMSTSEPPPAPTPTPEPPAPSDAGEAAPAGTDDDNPLRESRTRTAACQNFEQVFEGLTGKTLGELDPLRPRDPRAENPDVSRLENVAECDLGPVLTGPSQCSLVVCSDAGLASDVQERCCGGARPISLNVLFQQCMRERRCQAEDVECCADVGLSFNPESREPRPIPTPLGRWP